MTRSIILKVIFAVVLLVLVGCEKQSEPTAVPNVDSDDKKIEEVAKAVEETKPIKELQVARDSEKSIYNFTMNNIESQPVSLADYRGKVLMIVNVASKCGATPQYAQLQQIYEKYNDKGFYVMGFPANNFLG